MVVSTKLHDKTWRIHLNALLVLLHQNSSEQNSERRKRSPLQNAFQLLSPQNVCNAISTLQLSNFDQASLLLDVAKLALRGLNNEFNKVFSNIRTPRNLDVQKLRRSIKEVYDNLALIPFTLGREQYTARQEDTPASIQRLVHKTLTLITSTLLYQTTTFLQHNSTSRTPKTPPLVEINGANQRQVESICSTTYSLISTVRNSSRHVHKSCPSRPEPWRSIDPRVLGTIWPIYAASQLSISVTSRNCAKELLWDIGALGNIPVALFMVS